MNIQKFLPLSSVFLLTRRAFSSLGDRPRNSCPCDHCRSLALALISVNLLSLSLYVRLLFLDDILTLAVYILDTPYTIHSIYWAVSIYMTVTDMPDRCFPYLEKTSAVLSSRRGALGLFVAAAPTHDLQHMSLLSQSSLKR